VSEPGIPAVSDRLRTPSNALTALRLVLVPVLLVVLVGAGEPSDPRRLVALGIFVAAAATDRLDGLLARRRGEVTRFGILADPIADKALLLAAFAGLAWLGDLSWWAVAVVACRELLVTVVRLVVLHRGRLVPAVASGKVKTILQMVTVVVLLLPLPAVLDPAVLDPAVLVLVGLMLAVTVASGLEILVRLARRSPA